MGISGDASIKVLLGSTATVAQQSLTGNMNVPVTARINPEIFMFKIIV